MRRTGLAAILELYYNTIQNERLSISMMSGTSGKEMSPTPMRSVIFGRAAKKEGGRGTRSPVRNLSGL